MYISQLYFDLIKSDKKLISVPPISALIDIAFNEEEKNPKINITYLPYLNDKYIDGYFIYKNLRNENNIKEISVLFCIIDDNEYYNYPLSKLKKEIIINEVYFIYIKGNKKINIFDAIEKYLTILNKNIIKQITLGNGFFSPVRKMPIYEVINEAFIKNKNFSVQSSTLVKFNIKKVGGNEAVIKQRIYFIIYKLFEKAKIEGAIILDHKTYKNNIHYFKQNQYITGNVLIVKLYDNSYLSDNNFMTIHDELMNCDIPYVIYYLSQKKEKENNSKIKYGEKVKKALEIKIVKEFLLYTEIPRKISFEFNDESPHYYYQVTDHQNNIILYEKNQYDIKFLDYYYELIEKYEKFCYLKGRYYKDVLNFRDIIYFIKKKNEYRTYDIFKLSNHSKGPSLLDFFNYNNFDVKIKNVQNEEFPFDWKDILNDMINSKENIKINKKGKCGKKMNKKFNIKDELEEEMEEYSDESQEDNSDYDSQGENY